MKTESLSRLTIPAEKKTARRGRPVLIFAGVAFVLCVLLAAFFASKNQDRKPIHVSGLSTAPTNETPKAPPAPGEPVLTV
ncbi:MAG TPA: hypothetical protein VIH35_05090, partial [Kiritimatiellia bacterium]